MPKKTYVSDKRSIGVGFVRKDGKSGTAAFIGGSFATEDPEIQAAIEECSLFETGHIKIAPEPDPRVLLVKAAEDAQANAVKAAAAAKSAEDERAELDAKPKRLRAAADAAAKVAKDAVDAVAKFDADKAKKAAPAS